MMINNMNMTSSTLKYYTHRGGLLSIYLSLFILIIGNIVITPAECFFLSTTNKRNNLQRRFDNNDINLLHHQRILLPQPPSFSPTITSTSTTSLFMAGKTGKLWEKLQIDEDEEPYWYVLNCVAGLEMELLAQCRETCQDMDEVDKFVVPTIKTTRSHGANRMVQDTKTKYQGYVFAKLKLCAKTYETIQGLDLCRSWMGTINMKGYKKLPPIPLCLNEDEIENYGLENEEYEDDEEENIQIQVGDGENLDVQEVILDSEEQDKKEAEMENIVQTVYLGLRVEDMIKVTARNKFYNEDGIVRRLKDGKILVKFYTYGTMYEEWLDPNDVRKLSNIEILKGLSGPTVPITQQDLDGGPRDDYGGGRGPGRGDTRNMNRGLGGRGERNRKQDRVGRQFRGNDSGSNYDDRKERDNWNWYKDNERSQRGDAGFSEFGEEDNAYFRGGSSPSSRSHQPRNDWAGSDVDSQWGRSQQRNNRRPAAGRGGVDRRPKGQRVRNVRSNDKDDWSSFVSPASSSSSSSSQSGSSSNDENDDFFASLMTDLSKNLDSDDDEGSYGGGGGGRAGKQDADSTSSSSSNDDDFFASLMSEISGADDTKSGSSGGLSSSSSRGDGGGDIDDDFFASWAEDDTTTENKSNKASKNSNDEIDDFFAELSAGRDQDLATSTTTEANDDVAADDFFASLEAELDSELSGGFFEGTSSSDDKDDFEMPIAEEETPAAKEEMSSSSNNNNRSSPKKPSGTSPSKSSSSSTTSSGDLSKCTVPVLKGMLKERGLKVSGKKAELIERLTAAQ